MDVDHIVSAFERHQNVAFQFSGGRDSTAALFALRPFWNRMRIYHVDSGEQFPETRRVVAEVAQYVPIEVIVSDVEAIRKEHGLPSDLVPSDNTPFGRMVSGREVRITGRYDCCWRTLMEPMHRRMVQDGITLIVRGQRDEDYAVPPMRSGEQAHGVEVLYPIQDWTTADVDAYLQENGLPTAAFYANGMPHGSDCMGCTAWWDDRRATYLREFHPLVFYRYTQRMNMIRTEIDRQYEFMRHEMEGR